jgi:hypothetical protein
MTTEENKSGEQVAGQETGLPNPTFSEQKAVSSPSALTPEAIEAIAKGLSPMIEEQIERKLQSTKDKRFSTLEKGEGLMRETLALLKNNGVAIPKELEQELALKDYVDQRLQAVAPKADAGTSAPAQSQTGALNLVQMLAEFGLNANDPDVLKLAGGTYRNVDHLRAEAAALAINKLKTPSPSSTLAPAQKGMTPGTGLTDTDKESKSGRLRELYKQPSRYAGEIKALEKELGYT